VRKIGELELLLDLRPQKFGFLAWGTMVPSKVP